MIEKNEIMNCEIVQPKSNDIQIFGTEVATQLIAVIPNGIAAPFQRYHEVEVKKEIALKALEHRTMDRDKLCDTMVELAKNKALDKETFQMLMIAYINLNM